MDTKEDTIPGSKVYYLTCSVCDARGWPTWRITGTCPGLPSRDGGCEPSDLFSWWRTDYRVARRGKSHPPSLPLSETTSWWNVTKAAGFQLPATSLNVMNLPHVVKHDASSLKLAEGTSRPSIATSWPPNSKGKMALLTTKAKIGIRTWNVCTLYTRRAI